MHHASAQSAPCAPDAAGGPRRLDDIRLLLPLMHGIPRPAALCELLLDRFGTLARLVHAPPEQVRATDPALAPFAERLAAFRALHAELLRRPLETEPLLRAPVLAGTDAVARYLAARERPDDVERIGALLLDARLRLIDDVDIASGTYDRTHAYPREIARLVLDRNAAGVILHHNHPSADPSPSPGDWTLTDRVRETLACVDASLHDHFVVARGVAVSMANQQPSRFDPVPRAAVHTADRP